MKLEIRENRDFIIHKEHGRNYYEYIGDPMELLLVQFVIEYAKKNTPEVKIQKRHTVFLASLLFTLFMDLEDHLQLEKAKGNEEIVTEFKTMIIPSSKTYYTQNSIRPQQSMPYIKGLGRDLIESCLRLIGKKPSSEGFGGLSKSPMIIQINEGDNLKIHLESGQDEKRKFRTIFMRKIEDWGIWNRKEISKEDSLKAFAGYTQFQVFRSALRNTGRKCELTKARKRMDSLKKRNMAVIKDNTKIATGDEFKGNYSENENAYYIKAPSKCCKEMKIINNGFGEYSDVLAYTRVFNQNLDTGGRLFGLFSNLRKDKRRKLLQKLELIEVDLKNCAVNAFCLLKTGKWIEGDFYEGLAIQIGKRLKHTGPSQSPFHNEQGVLSKAWRGVFKRMVTIAVGAKDKRDGKAPSQKYLSKKGIYLTQKEVTTGDIRLSDSEKWRTASLLLGDGNAPFIKLSFDDVYESLKELTRNSFFEYLYSHSSGISMNIESNTLVRVLTDMVSKGFLPLACHDAVFVPTGMEEYYERLFMQCLEEEAAKYKQAFQRTA